MVRARKPGSRSPHEALRNRMTQLSEIYNQRILELSANIAGAERLADADAHARPPIPSCAAPP